MTVDDEIALHINAEAVRIKEEDDSDHEEVETSKKKKKRKPKKKKSVATIEVNYKESDLKPQMMRMLGGYTNYYIKYGQTEEPSIKVLYLPNCHLLLTLK